MIDNRVAVQRRSVRQHRFICSRIGPRSYPQGIPSWEKPDLILETWVSHVWSKVRNLHRQIGLMNAGVQHRRAWCVIKIIGHKSRLFFQVYNIVSWGYLRVTANPPGYAPSRVGIHVQCCAAIVVDGRAAYDDCRDVTLSRGIHVEVAGVDRRPHPHASISVQADIAPYVERRVAADIRAVVAFDHLRAANPCTKWGREQA